MKKIIFPAIVLVCMFLFACNKVKYDDMTIVRDCTGTYLRLDGKDYRVCNLEKTDGIANGTVVRASFIRLAGCTQDGFFCKMYHMNEGWVEVQSIK